MSKAKILSDLSMLNVPFESLALSVGVSVLANLLIIIWFAQTTAHFTNRNATGAVQTAHSKPSNDRGS